MKYIDKFVLHKIAHEINVGFLQDCYRADISNPLPSPDEPKASFRDFCKPDYRDNYQGTGKGWKHILFDEQNFSGASRCCYCMRKLDDSAGRINYEHVMPRSLKGEEGQDQYENFYSPLAPAIEEHVMMADQFRAKVLSSIDEIKEEKKMPHITALSNLTAACNGVHDHKFTRGCCCNGVHSNDKELPLMLMPIIEDAVNYDENGIMNVMVEGKIVNDSKVIKELNQDTLQIIRSIWYHLSRVSIDITNAHSMTIPERISWFKTAYQTPDFSSLDERIKPYIGQLGSTGDEEYWRTLLAYDWFYFYPKYAKQRV